MGSPNHRNPHTPRERYDSVSDKDTVIKRSRECPDHRVGKRLCTPSEVPWLCGTVKRGRPNPANKQATSAGGWPHLKGALSLNKRHRQRQRSCHGLQRLMAECVGQADIAPVVHGRDCAV